MDKRMIVVSAVIFVFLVTFVLLISIQPKADVIKIGVMGPLTGDAGVYGQSIKEGIDLALDEVNRNEIKIALIYEDNKCDAKEAVNVVNKLINVDRVPVVISEACSSTLLAAAPIAEQSKVVLIGTTESNPNIKNAGDFVFRIYPSDDYQGKVIAEFVYGKNYRNAAILHINNDAGKGIAYVFKDRFEKLGGSVVISESFESGASDFRVQLLKIKEKNPDMIFLASHFKEASISLKQAKELNITTQFIAPEGLKNQELIKLADESAEGLMASSPIQNKDENYQKFRAAYIAKYKKEPTGYAIDYGYDVLKVVALAIEKAKSTDPDEIKNTLYGIHDYRGASGLINFDEFGEVTGKDYEFFVVRNGTFVSLQN